MARSDLVVTLVRTGSTGDKREVRVATEAIIAEARQKRHTILPHHWAYELVSEPAAVSWA